MSNQLITLLNEVEYYSSVFFHKIIETDFLRTKYRKQQSKKV